MSATIRVSSGSGYGDPEMCTHARMIIGWSRGEEGEGEGEGGSSCRDEAASVAASHGWEMHSVEV